MEELTALCCLWVSGMGTKSEYTERLDELFLQDPENDLLLELEGLTGDERGTLAKFCITEENAGKFGKFLLSKVENYYINNVSDKPGELEKFAELAYKLWTVLSRFRSFQSFDLAYSNPFYIFNYADDPLSWGDKEQSVELYQKAFNYYKEQLDQ